MDKEEIAEYVEMLAKQAGATIKDKVGSFSLNDEQIRLFTGLNYDGLSSLATLLTSTRNLKGRSIMQALVTRLGGARGGT